MAHVPLADVLWDAANKYLSPSYYFTAKGTEPFTCHALAKAVYGPKWGNFNHPAFRFLKRLGCDLNSSGFESEHYADDREMQGDRYMWLLIAMHAAEDEGILVEVAQ